MGQTALTTCWFTRRHVPAIPPRYRQDGAFRSVCRHCQSAIHSHDRKYWRLSNGFNPDELAGNTDYIAIVDQGDGLVIARLPIDANLRADQLKDRLKEVRQRYANESGESAFSFVVHRSGNKRAHAV